MAHAIGRKEMTERDDKAKRLGLYDALTAMSKDAILTELEYRKQGKGRELRFSTEQLRTELFVRGIIFKIDEVLR